jgi:hypothetical protein
MVAHAFAFCAGVWAAALPPVVAPSYDYTKGMLFAFGLLVRIHDYTTGMAGQPTGRQKRA